MCTPSTEWGFSLFGCCALLFSSREVNWAVFFFCILSGAYEARGVARFLTSDPVLDLPGVSSMGTRMLIARGCWWWWGYRWCCLSRKIPSSSLLSAGDCALPTIGSLINNKENKNLENNMACNTYRLKVMLDEGSSWAPFNWSLFFNGLRVMRHDSSWSYLSTGFLLEKVRVSLRTPL